MRLHRTRLALFVVAALAASAAAQDGSPDSKPVQQPGPSTPVEVVDPMANFGRLVSGEWWVTFDSGAKAFGTWHWGPGRHSVRMGGAAQVYYWHPGRKQVCMFGLEPFAAGVSEGTITFDGDTADAVFDLYQTGDLRKMGLHWAFDGPDKYTETLLEATGPEGLKPMNKWVHVRSRTLTPPRPPAAEAASKLPERWKALEALSGQTWEASGRWASGESLHIRSTLERIADVEGMSVRTVALGEDGAPADLLDAYLYRHTGTGALRCLALSSRGGVYEGDWSMLDGGALQLELKGCEGEQVVSLVVRFDFETDGTLRQRAWSVEGAERTLMLDVHHEKRESK